MWNCCTKSHYINLCNLRKNCWKQGTQKLTLHLLLHFFARFPLFCVNLPTVHSLYACFLNSIFSSSLWTRIIGITNQHVLPLTFNQFETDTEMFPVHFLLATLISVRKKIGKKIFLEFFFNKVNQKVQAYKTTVIK